MSKKTFIFFSFLAGLAIIGAGCSKTVPSNSAPIYPNKNTAAVSGSQTMATDGNIPAKAGTTTLPGSTTVVSASSSATLKSGTMVSSSTLTVSSQPAVGNLIRAIREVSGVGKAPVYVEMELNSQKNFPVRNELVILDLGGMKVSVSRYPDSGETNTLIFTINKADFAKVKDGATVSVYYGLDGTGDRWEFGALNKGLLQQSTPPTTDKDSAKQGPTHSSKQGTPADAKQVTADQPGTYEAYAPSKLALEKNGRVVIFFKAGWCPTCGSLDKDIMAHLKQIPSGTHILIVDFDSANDLKQKYGITYQHTFVQVDANGRLLKKWAGSATLADLLGQIL